MKKKKRKFPDFNKMSYEEEANWWDTHDIVDYEGETKDVEIVFDLKKPRDEMLIVRLQKDIKDKLAQIARSRGLDMSTLARMWLLEKLRESRTK